MTPEQSVRNTTARAQMAYRQRVGDIHAVVPADSPEVFAAFVGLIGDTSDASEAEITQLQADLAAARAKIQHDYDYWQGRIKSAMEDLREAAALIADANGAPQIGLKIRGLEIKW